MHLDARGLPVPIALPTREPHTMSSFSSLMDRLVQRFVSEVDTSITAANEIDVALDNGFPQDDYVQQTVEMLAMYRPEGGEFLFGTAAIKRRLIETMKHLQKVART